jgi:Lon protease-like protein
MPATAVYKTVSDLPTSLPIFPLPGAVLLPGGDLPLNIFEPRYLRMLSDALGSHRLIGMIQPRNVDREGDPALSPDSPDPDLYSIGCAGRITSFHEDGNGPVQIILSGVCRFKVLKELDSALPYRSVVPDFQPFACDLSIDDLDESDAERRSLLDSLDKFLKARSMRADWDEIEAASTPTLINTLVMIGSFSPREKQAVLEAANLRERTRTLVMLTNMSIEERFDGNGSGSLQ